MEEKKKYNKTTYNNMYNSMYKKQFNCSLKIDEYNEICNFLKQNKINKSEFIRIAYKKIKDDYK